MPSGIVILPSGMGPPVSQEAKPAPTSAAAGSAPAKSPAVTPAQASPQGPSSAPPRPWQVSYEAWSQIPDELQEQYIRNYRQGRTRMTMTQAWEYFRKHYAPTGDPVRTWLERYAGLPPVRRPSSSGISSQPSASSELAADERKSPAETAFIPWQYTQAYARTPAGREAAYQDYLREEAIRQELDAQFPMTAANYPRSRRISDAERLLRYGNRDWLGEDAPRVQTFRVRETSPPPGWGTGKVTPVRPKTSRERAEWEARHRAYLSQLKQRRDEANERYRRLRMRYLGKYGEARDNPPEEQRRLMFKFGFLARCADEGLSAEQTQARIALAADPDALEKVGMSPWAAVPIIALSAMGGGMGYALANLTDADVSVDDVRAKELAALYRERADRLRRLARRYAMRQKRDVPPPPQLATS